MRITGTSALVASLLVAGVTRASAQSTWQQQRDQARQAIRSAAAEARELYQGRRGPEQSDTFSRKVKLGREGRVSVSNISGDIIVTAGSSDEVSIDAVKRGRGDRGALDRVNIIVEEHAGRVEVRTEYGSPRRGDGVSVDYMVTVPAGASLDVYSTSGNTRVTGVKGSIRLSSVSGKITTSGTPRVEYVRSVSGDVDLADVSHDGNLSITSVSSSIRAAGIRARALDVNSVSGDIALRDAACERLNARSVSGAVEYAGTLAKNGRYEVSAQSGGIRFSLAGGVGFELDATSFSGSVRSEFPLTIGGDSFTGGNGDVVLHPHRGPSRGAIHATSGDGSATLTLRTFSGDIAILKTTNK